MKILLELNKEWENNAEIILESIRDSYKHEIKSGSVFKKVKSLSGKS